MARADQRRDGEALNVVIVPRGGDAAPPEGLRDKGSKGNWKETSSGFKNKTFVKLKEKVLH